VRKSASRAPKKTIILMITFLLLGCKEETSISPLIYESNGSTYSKPHSLGQCKYSSEIKKFEIASHTFSIPYKNVVSGVYEENGKVIDFTAGNIKCIDHNEPSIKAIKVIIRLPKFKTDRALEKANTEHFYATRAIIKDKKVFLNNLKFFEDEYSLVTDASSIIPEKHGAYSVYQKDLKQKYIVFTNTDEHEKLPVFKCYPYAYELGAHQTCKSLFSWRGDTVVELYEVSEPWVTTDDLRGFYGNVKTFLNNIEK
tara:strand:- start:462 stop:1226 length:765 start_codon:yes stop_codon:yes gene_type:complete